MTDTPKKKILIVDDDSFLLDMYALKFSQSGYEVNTALGAPIALAKIQGGFIPDILLLDIMMPEMNGFEFLQKLKDEKLLTAAKKVILSNEGEESELIKGKEFGVDGYIIKANATPGEVIEQINRIIA